MIATLEAVASVNRSRLERLVRFIRSHGHEAYIRDERIVAVAHCVGVSGVPFAAVETIEPTFAAAREWLGY